VLVGEATRAWVSGDGECEGILQLQEVGGVPFCSSAGVGTRRGSILHLGGGGGTAGRCGSGELWEARKIEAALGALCGSGKKKMGTEKLGFYRRWGPGRGSTREGGSGARRHDLSAVQQGRGGD
jgi:hypothetical protein